MRLLAIIVLGSEINSDDFPFLSDQVYLLGITRYYLGSDLWVQMSAFETSFET